MRSILISLITIYQRLISPLYPPCCRFVPSCSEYARQAIATHGVCKGSALAMHRILRCHPLCAGGYDPVPSPNTSKRE